MNRLTLTLSRAGLFAFTDVLPPLYALCRGGTRPGQRCAWGNHACCARSSMKKSGTWKVGALFNALILVYEPQLILMMMHGLRVRRSKNERARAD